MNPKKLYRSCDDRIIGGVAGGLAEYFEIDAILVRLVWLLVFFSGGIGLLLYIIAWVLIPNDPKCGDKKAGDEIKEKADQVAHEVRKVAKNDKDRSNVTVLIGLLLVVFGIVLVFQNVIGFDIWRNFWPALIIIVGLVLIYRSKEN